MKVRAELNCLWSNKTRHTAADSLATDICLPATAHKYRTAAVLKCSTTVSVPTDDVNLTDVTTRDNLRNCRFSDDAAHSTASHFL
jgi:3-dehydroquinate dehydratase